ncbi:MAG: Holliday junction branch migration protein RuvA [Bdellovibrionales bacterium]|nr:Holliday junction branch migration protein RuvA [Bdellovibrionales bacterium]
MIGYLKGEIKFYDLETVLLFCGGIGYEVICTPSTLSQVLGGKKEVELWIYTHVREDILQLYGFFTLLEKQLFLSLIKVNGIGPRSALQILGATALESLVDLINKGDAKGLSQLPKVGKKTAEQIILTLKGKLVLLESSDQPSTVSNRGAITSALVNLGFKATDVDKVVAKMSPNLDLESGVREGLVALTSASF